MNSEVAGLSLEGEMTRYTIVRDVIYLCEHLATRDRGKQLPEFLRPQLSVVIRFLLAEECVRSRLHSSDGQTDMHLRAQMRPYGSVCPFLVSANVLQHWTERTSAAYLRKNETAAQHNQAQASGWSCFSGLGSLGRVEADSGVLFRRGVAMYFTLHWSTLRCSVCEAAPGD
jgi:hypothetical protein